MEATGGMIIGTTITIITVPVRPAAQPSAAVPAVASTCQAITNDCPEIGCGAPDSIFLWIHPDKNTKMYN
jgi:hypothetical protein